MPLKLPAPDFGTDEQAGPKFTAAAAADPPDPPDPADAEDAGADEPEPEAADEEDPLELHAASPRLATASPDTARRRYFISLLLIYGFICGHGLVPSRGCGAVT
jgi:hypothetical protein